MNKKSYFKEQSLIDSQIENPITDDPLSDDFTDFEDGEIEQEEETQAPLSPEDWYLD